MCAGILATFAITLIFKTSYTTNFAQGVISALGAYVAVELTLAHGLPLWGVAIIGVVVAFGVGVIIDVCIFRQGKNVNALDKKIGYYYNVLIKRRTIVLNLEKHPYFEEYIDEKTYCKYHHRMSYYLQRLVALHPSLFGGILCRISSLWHQ